MEETEILKDSTETLVDEELGLDKNSEVVQEVLESTPVWMIRWGNTLFLAIIIIMLIFTWFIKYPDKIEAKATIITKIPLQKIKSTQLGRISEILVNEYDTINAREPIAVIENIAVTSDVYYLKNALDSVHINQYSFDFPLKEMPILRLGEITPAYAEFENKYQAYSLNRLQNPLNEEIISNSKVSVESLNQLKLLNEQRKIILDEIELKNINFLRHKKMHQKGIISKKDYEVIEIEILQNKKALNNIDNQISQIRASTQTNTHQINSLKIKKSQTELTLFSDVLHSLFSLQKSIKEWENKYVMYSNIPGQVAFVEARHINQYIDPSQIAFSVMPLKNNGYIAKLKAPAQNMGKIQIGQKVQIKLDHYPYREYGILEGKIFNIVQISDKDKQYTIEVELPNKLETSYHKTIAYKQEMPGSAEVITKELRLIERFFHQLRSVVDQN
ncbi:HlyD family secretion protein [Aureibacter tunicatorum]|uniref:Multidrug efflux pump subunit AcrA (Membrane-fusion protein) n=1 Tax=Aureibacter tunicatorum TaxID=866807 RepID=A0AAE3XQR9_9BACT|nr:HlyD family efflux transporter periplasmic adaptor subunit [Aureibacter tunicatorum]MDR6241412.1 multidrug efflux pump subunit AcrA (membrane-fusion protein) [Aureibacter tunicatorum]BDD06743.1 hemolysin [Aureibacter tunicatorum]